MCSRYAAFAIPNGEYLWQNHIAQQKKIAWQKWIEVLGKKHLDKN